jgi:ankyrin repeat protein
MAIDNINALDAEGNTAAMRAAMEGNVEALKEAQAAGADLNLRNKDGKTAAMLAAGAGNAEVLRAMKRGPSLVNVATDDGGTPAMSAACHGRADALVALIEMGATLDVQDGAHVALPFAIRCHPSNSKFVFRPVRLDGLWLSAACLSWLQLAFN